MDFECLIIQRNGVSLENNAGSGEEEDAWEPEVDVARSVKVGEYSLGLV